MCQESLLEQAQEWQRQVLQVQPRLVQEAQQEVSFLLQQALVLRQAEMGVLLFAVGSMVLLQELLEQVLELALALALAQGLRAPPRQQALELL